MYMYDLFNDHTSADDAVAVDDATARELHTKAKFIDARTILRWLCVVTFVFPCAQ